MKGWLTAAAISLVAHASFAAWVESREPAKKPHRAPIEMRLAAAPKKPPPTPKVVEPPPPPPAPPKHVVKKLAPAPVAVPEIQKVGVTPDPTNESDLHMAAGSTLEGDVGTGNTMDKVPPPPEVPPPAPAAPAPAAQGKHYVPEFKVTRLPQPKSAIRPELPSAFREAQREAHVIIEVEIDEAGHVANAKLVGKDEFGLAPAVIAAVEHTDFEPALVGTQPVPVRYHIPFTFRVHG